MVGLPGSGKSTLAGSVAEKNGIAIIRVGRFGQRRLYARLFAICHSELYRALRRIAVEQSGTNEHLTRINEHRLASAAAKVQKARLLGRGVVDEGVLQFLLGVYERPARVEELETVLLMIPAAGLRICFVQANEATRLARMQARNKVPRAELGSAYQASWQAAQTANVALLHRLCASRFDCVTIDNSG